MANQRIPDDVDDDEDQDEEEDFEQAYKDWLEEDTQAHNDLGELAREMGLVGDVEPDMPRPKLDEHGGYVNDDDDEDGGDEDEIHAGEDDETTDNTSFFETCERDEKGHCEPGEGSGAGGGGERSGSSGMSHEQIGAALDSHVREGIEAMRTAEQSVKSKSARKIIQAVAPVGQDHLKKVEQAFDDLTSHIKDDKAANDFAKGLGYRAVTGDKDKVLRQLKQKYTERIGTFMRAYA